MRLCKHCGTEFDETLKVNGEPKKGRKAGRSRIYCSRKCACNSFEVDNPHYPHHTSEYRENERTARLEKRLAVLRAIGVDKSWLCPCGFSGVPTIDHITERGYWGGCEHRARTQRKVVADLHRLLQERFDITTIVQPLCLKCNITKAIRNLTPEEFALRYQNVGRGERTCYEPDEVVEHIEEQVFRKEGKWWDVDFGVRFEGEDNEL